MVVHRFREYLCHLSYCNTADTYARACIDSDTEKRVIHESRSLFELKVPNAITCEVITELEDGKAPRFASVYDLMANLHADE